MMKGKTLTNEQVERLAQYEPYFKKAINADWSPYPGIVALEEMHKAVGDGIRLNANCQSCVLNLIKTCGRLYYEAKERIEVDVVEVEASAGSVLVKTGSAKKQGKKPKK